MTIIDCIASGLNVHSPSLHLITASVRDHELNDPGPLHHTAGAHQGSY